MEPTVSVACVTFDCADPERLVEFWAAALGYTPRGNCCYPTERGGPFLEFVRVPEQKTTKNRVHLGLSTDDVSAEVERLCSLGATPAWEEEFPAHWTYRNVVLRDPEGNEICLGGPPGAFREDELA